MSDTPLKQAVREWLVQGGARGGIPDADRRVIYADQDGARVPMPYLTIQVDDYDGLERGGEEGYATDAGPDDGNPDGSVWIEQGPRTARASVNAYGAGADVWLEAAVLALGQPSILRLLDERGVTIQPLGPARNLSALRDGVATERRILREFELDYYRSSTADETRPVVELGPVEHTDVLAGVPEPPRVVLVVES